MHHLALIALALMLCMPVLSRWQQGMTQTGQVASEMCRLSDAQMALLMPQVHAHAHQHPAGEGSPPQQGHHHHDACAYCTLATRMLPVLALVLSLPALPPVQHSGHLTLPVTPPAPTWPAHSPRGPPPLS